MVFVFQNFVRFNTVLMRFCFLEQIGILPRHFLPPLAVNALLGTVLWTTYSETSQLLEDHLSHPLSISAISGGIAGGMQAIVAAPAENVRLAIEGTSHTHSGWTSAWRHVFLGTSGKKTMSKSERIHEARMVGHWMKEVGEMAGRGWNGWSWGFAKDVCGEFAEIEKEQTCLSVECRICGFLCYIRAHSTDGAVLKKMHRAHH
jgi:hypothetical protein